MRLINPGLGELLDRLSILELKLAHGGGDHFAREEDHLRAQLGDPLMRAAARLGAGGAANLCTLVVRLAAVNAALWEAEDNLRWQREGGGYEKNPGPSAHLAHRIQVLNDKRAALVRELSRLAGEDWQEKL